MSKLSIIFLGMLHWLSIAHANSSLLCHDIFNNQKLIKNLTLDSAKDEQLRAIARLQLSIQTSPSSEHQQKMEKLTSELKKLSEFSKLEPNIAQRYSRILTEERAKFEILKNKELKTEAIKKQQVEQQSNTYKSILNVELDDNLNSRHIAVSKNKSHLVYLSRDSNNEREYLNIINLHTMESKKYLESFTDAIMDIAIIEGKNTIAIARHDGSTSLRPKYFVELENLDRYQDSTIIELPESLNHKLIYKLMPSPDGKYLLIKTLEARSNNADAVNMDYLVNLSNLEIITSYKSFSKSEWSLDSRYLASGQSGKAIVIWDLETNQSFKIQNDVFPDKISVFNFSSDSKYLIFPTSKNRMSILDLESQELIKNFDPVDLFMVENYMDISNSQSGYLIYKPSTTKNPQESTYHALDTKMLDIKFITMREHFNNLSSETAGLTIDFENEIMYTLTRLSRGSNPHLRIINFEGLVLWDTTLSSIMKITDDKPISIQLSDDKKKMIVFTDYFCKQRLVATRSGVT